MRYKCRVFFQKPQRHIANARIEPRSLFPLDSSDHQPDAHQLSYEIYLLSRQITTCFLSCCHDVEATVRLDER